MPQPPVDKRATPDQTPPLIKSPSSTTPSPRGPRLIGTTTCSCAASTALAPRKRGSQICVAYAGRNGQRLRCWLAVGARAHAAIAVQPDSAWTVNVEGDPRNGADVIESTGMVGVGALRDYPTARA